MLVLSRQTDETVVFPGLGISVQVLRCSSSSVRLGIDAPREIAILRGEIADDKNASPHITPAALGSKSPIAQSLLPSLKQTIHQAAETLNRLHCLSESSSDKQSEAAIYDLFGQLQKLDSKITSLMEPAPQRNVRALLVDDNDNESRLLSSYLKIKGIDVTTAKNGQIAMETMSNQEMDVVLLDMSMPQFDGRWTIDQIRGDQHLENMTVFAVTGAEQSGSGVELGPRGVNRWFRKPLNPDDLISQITDSCDTQQAVLN